MSIKNRGNNSPNSYLPSKDDTQGIATKGAGKAQNSMTSEDRVAGVYAGSKSIEDRSRSSMTPFGEIHSDTLKEATEFLHRNDIEYSIEVSKTRTETTKKIRTKRHGDNSARQLMTD